MCVRKVGTSFATKLNILIIGLQLLAISGVVAACGYSLYEDYPQLVLRSHRQTASNSISRIRTELQRFIDRAGAAATIYSADYKSDEEKTRHLKELLIADNHISGAAYFEKISQVDGAKLRWYFTNENYPAADLRSLQLVGALQIDAMGRNDLDANLVKLEDGRQVIRLAITIRSPGRDRAAATTGSFWIIDVKAPWIEGLLTESMGATMFLTDSREKILVSSERSLMEDDAKLDHSLQTAVQGTQNAANSQTIRQVEYVDNNGIQQTVFAGQIGLAGMRLFAQIPNKQISIVTFGILKKAIAVATMIFILSLVLAFLFSARIKYSILNLWVAAMKVAKGDYSTRLPVPKHTGWLDSDELKAFAGTFNEMVSGLEERSRVVALLSKLHGKELAEHFKSKRLNLGGERKHCIVFFSDIRGFTSLSEKSSPELVVQILNRYLTAMMKVIEANHGIVTGIQGDGIMAVWGLHEATEFAADVAINACFEMRKALNSLNNEFISEGKQPLYMGMGLHYGPIIAGTIGSHNRMEFTAIGDTANTASRIESATKEFGTDLLISDKILEQAKGTYLLEKVEVKVKGKQKTVTLHKVFGTKDPFGERHIRTPYSDYKPDKMKSEVFADTTSGGTTVEPAQATAKNEDHKVIDLPKQPRAAAAGTTSASAAANKRPSRPRGWSG